MRCENCNGIGIVNLYEKTGENISTDCHLCNGTGQISHPVKGMKPLALLLSAILALPAYAQPDTTTPPPAPLTLYERAVMGTPVPARLLRAVAIVESGERDDAIGPDGWDKGRMQIREQFRDLRIPLIGYEYDPHDPYDSTRLAALILQDHYNRFGCWRLAVSAYNRGAGWVTENGVCSEYCLKVWIAERGLNDKSTRSK